MALIWLNMTHSFVSGGTWVDKLAMQFEATPCDEYARTRAVGEDSEAILQDWLSLAEAEIAQLKQAGVLS
jgi:crotonobetainyl-CoA:carnitine CoA-transferase CaiB-like acyl-CoA transferase